MDQTLASPAVQVHLSPGPDHLHVSCAPLELIQAQSALFKTGRVPSVLTSQPHNRARGKYTIVFAFRATLVQTVVIVVRAIRAITREWKAAQIACRAL